MTFRYSVELKDRVKAIRGARWNSNERCWYFAEDAARAALEPLAGLGFSVPVFDGSDAGEPSADHSAPETRLGEAGDLTVNDLWARVQHVVGSAYPGSVWVVGVLQNVRGRGDRGYLFLEMVDDPDSDRPLSLSLFVSRQALGQVEFSLRQAGLALTEGLRVRVSGRLSVNRRNQVQFNVASLDARYSLGELALRRDEILATLRSEGILVRNRQLPAPAAPLRLALVTASGSEAAADVMTTLNESGYAFATTVFDVRVQGPELERTVVAALGQVADRAAEFDLCLIVRGGGSRVELSSWDNLAVARAVALLPVKVLVGLGHTGDSSVLDEIALSFKTPTAVADECVRFVDGAWSAADAAFEQLTQLAGARITTLARQLQNKGRAFASTTERRLTTEQRRCDDRERQLERLAVQRMHREAQRVQRAEVLLPRLAGQQRLALESERLRRAQQQMAGLWRKRLMAEEAGVARSANALARASRSRLSREERHMTDVDRLIRLVHPSRSLERGFTLVRDSSGAIVTKAADVSAGQHLRVIFHDGPLAVHAIERVESGEEEQ